MMARLSAFSLWDSLAVEQHVVFLLVFRELHRRRQFLEGLLDRASRRMPPLLRE
jgi:heme exporter protein D